MNFHAPVLLVEVLEALDIKHDGVYFDGTFGRGGHSAAILAQLGPLGQLIAVDRDDAAIEFGKKQFAHDSRLTLVKNEFSNLGAVIRDCVSDGKVDGIFLDIGVSSPQLEDPQRGFSFRFDGPLDMRMDSSKGVSAATWLATAELQEIRTVIKTFGEERFAHRIATAIVSQRAENPIITTGALAKLIASVVPHKEQRIHPATRSFQAIRIFINKELEQLEQALNESIDVLKDSGRLAVISFHSLEDRIVKRFMRDQSKSDEMYSGMPVVPDSAKARLKLVGKQVRASDEEVEQNPRSRSAVLRVAQRVSL